MSKDMIQAPSPQDYSEEAMRKAALSDSIQHPATLVPIGLGMVSGIGLLALTPLMIPGLLVLAGGAVFGGLCWGVNFFGRHDAFQIRYHRALHERSKQAAKAKLQELSEVFRSDVECQQGVAQIDALTEKFDNLRIVLERKLDQGELTFSRYLGTAEQIYRSALENLHVVASLLISVRDININDLDEQIRRVKRRSTSKNGVEGREIAALDRRRDLYTKTMEEVQQRLVENEEALTALDDASVAAARIDTTGMTVGSGSSHMELAMGELARLVKRSQERPKALSLDDIRTTSQQEGVPS